MEPSFWPLNLQWVFKTRGIAQSRNLNNCFVLLEDESNKNSRLWVAKIMLLFQVLVNDCKKQNKLAFAPSIYVTTSLDDVKRALECVTLIWSTDKNIAYILAHRDRVVRRQKLKASERLATESSCYIKSTYMWCVKILLLLLILRTCQGISDASTLRDFPKHTLNIRSKKENCANIERKNSSVTGLTTQKLSCCAVYSKTLKKQTNKEWKQKLLKWIWRRTKSA